MAGTRAAEEQARLAEEKKLEEERRRVSWDSDNNMGLAREDQITPNGAVQALMDVLGLGGEAAPVQANVAAPNREKAFAQMAARYPEMPAARLDTLKSAIMQTGDEERQSSLIGGKLAPSWGESEIKLPESKATLNKLNAEANEARVSASESKDRMEGGFYVTLTGRNGEILGMYNPKGGPDGKGRFISAEEIQQQGGINEPLRRGPLSTAELTR